MDTNVTDIATPPLAAAASSCGYCWLLHAGMFPPAYLRWLRAQVKKQQLPKRQSENTKPPCGRQAIPRLPLPAFEDAEDLHGSSRELMRL